jgi:MFS transporter, putative metabolite:H+ symporter
MHPALIVAALGYFVDVFDIWLYGVYRVASLTELGYSGEALAQHSTTILNAQMIGMVLGGLVFGVMGDKIGRKASLFGSIMIYASATIFNAFVWDATSYTIARGIAGFGLAGELGAGVTLTMEILKKDQRGWAPTIIAAFGMLGCLTAGLMSDFVAWRTAYLIGGVMGFALFLLRLQVTESNLFIASKQTLAPTTRHGSLVLLLGQRDRLWRYLLCIMIGAPVWYVAGMLLLFAPEFGVQFGVDGVVKSGHATLYFFMACAAGDLASGYLSQRVRSRRRVMLGFLLLLAASCGFYLAPHALTLGQFYALFLLLGFFCGYWAIFMASVTEQFGTNLRATAATTVPNFVRGSVVLMTLCLGWLKPDYGLVGGSALIGVVVLGLAIMAVWLLPESFDREMDFIEE